MEAYTSVQYLYLYYYTYTYTTILILIFILLHLYYTPILILYYLLTHLLTHLSALCSYTIWSFSPGSGFLLLPFTLPWPYLGCWRVVSWGPATAVSSIPPSWPGSSQTNAKGRTRFQKNYVNIVFLFKGWGNIKDS